MINEQWPQIQRWRDTINFSTIFNESYSRSLGQRTSRANMFFDEFYERFIDSDPQIASKFVGIDMASQKAMLKQSIALLPNLFVTQDVPNSLRDVAIKHDQQHLDVPPRLYVLWMDCLIETARTIDPKFNDDVELAWRMACAPGIAFMIHTWKHSNQPMINRTNS